jgi:diguanylate cyclase (GGDEF)-like protein/PAS domain S-box-containing protein
LSGVGFWELDHKANTLYWSEEIFAIYGIDPNALAPNYSIFANLIFDDDREMVEQAFKASVENGKKYNIRYRVKCEVSFKWIEAKALTYFDESSNPERSIGTAQDISEIINAEEKLKRMAHYDILTDLPNRVLLSDRINQGMVQCQYFNQSLAIAYLDLDGFKVVNDTYGHDVGDELLITVSQRMQEALRDGDTLARIGGDEFVVVMVDLEKIKDSEPVLKRLLKAAAKPVALCDDVMQVSASIGVTLYPQDGAESDADQLVRHANEAMYIAKHAGKNCYHLFDTAQNNAVIIRGQSIADVRSALVRQEFLLHYQPKVNMNTGEVIGVEALIRWQHPVRGLVPPLEFLPAIEGHAISLDVGEWVIDTALSQINQWQNIGVNLPISVNISAHQLQ